VCLGGDLSHDAAPENIYRAFKPFYDTTELLATHRGPVADSS
jgi:hypothetical protein